MLNRLSINLILGLVLTHKASATRKHLTLTTEELGGDSTEISSEQPFVVHLDKNSMSAEALEDLARTSNIDVASLPEFPQFLNLGEFESMKYSTDQILEELVREQDLDLDTVKQNERFYEIEEILKDIAEEYADQDERQQCSRGQYKDRSSKGDDYKYRYPCGKPKKSCCGKDKVDYDEDYWYDDEYEDFEKKLPGTDDKKGSDGYKDDGKDDKVDEKLDDKSADKLEKDLDEKLDEKVKDKLDDTKNDEKDQKDNDKQFLWDEEEEQDEFDYDEDEDDYLTIKEPQYEETFWGTEISVGKTIEPLEPTKSVSSNESITSAYVTTSSMVYNTTLNYSTRYNSTSSAEKSTVSSSYIATSIYSSSRVSSRKEHDAVKTTTQSAYSSSRVSTKSASKKHETTTTGSKRDRKNSATLVPNWKSQSNISNVTVQGGMGNSSNMLMPTTLLFASLLAALAILQV